MRRVGIDPTPISGLVLKTSGAPFAFPRTCGFLHNI